MRKTNRHKKINGRKKRTLKMRGGDLDDPDTKDFMNSKFTDLEQKFAELENNMPVQIGYKNLKMNGGGDLYGIPTLMPLFVNKNISVEDFWKYVNKGNQNNAINRVIHIFLPVLYSLPNVRGLRISECYYSFNAEGMEDYKYLHNTNLDALNAKYPGLFVQ
jgi:hypothetical protein